MRVGAADAEPRRRPGVLSARLEDGVVLYDPGARVSHVLNRSAAAVWDVCDGRAASEITDAVVVRFGADQDAVQRDVDSLLASLGEAGLLEGSDPPKPPRPLADLPRPSDLEHHHARLSDAGRWTWLSPTYAAMDFCFSVRVDDEGLRAFLQPILESLQTDGRGDAHRYAIRRDRRGRLVATLDGHLIRRTSDAPAMARFLLWHVNRMAVEGTRRRLVLHAAGAAAEGRVVILPATANSGKSTLVAELVARGLDYLSDESLALDPTGEVVRPYPRSISLDPGSWPVLPHLRPVEPGVDEAFHRSSWQVPPQRIRPSCISGPGTLALAIFPHYVSDAPTTLEPLSPTEALVELLANSFDFPTLGQRGMDRLARLATETPVFELRSGSLEQAADAVQRALAAT
jgi:hypothetical protein